MNPGPDLDAEVARKILEVVVIFDSDSGEYQLRDLSNRKTIPLPPYSTDTASAHQLISKYKAAGCTFAINANPDGTWVVTVQHPQLAGVKFGASGQTLPHAICQAILQFNSLFKLSR